MGHGCRDQDDGTVIGKDEDGVVRGRWRNRYRLFSMSSFVVSSRNGKNISASTAPPRMSTRLLRRIMSVAYRRRAREERRELDPAHGQGEEMCNASPLEKSSIWRSVSLGSSASDGRGTLGGEVE